MDRSGRIIRRGREHESGWHQSRASKRGSGPIYVDADLRGDMDSATP